ncbi:winged helix-turn-helix transcriptional regulator [uncultured Trichococcus sp.]|uniref:winged helix-turn-helix transcriptional regulator n=1 Tax=uncultured Trichococcus sp. TaxID=189665 RepID=UPI0029C99AEC|nr:winged helix-turn-helix transcriptional regulator [uncultured Trichococcus sp.]
MLTKEELPFFPVATPVDLIGNKWKLLIMRELLTGTKRFIEMHRLVDGISQKVLTENLRKMESDGIVKREVFPEVPPRVEYSLTDLGDSLRPIINSMSDWGTDYIKNKPA